MYWLGIDIGGTNIAGAISDDSGNLLISKIIPTKAPRLPEEICLDIKNLVYELSFEAGIPYSQIGRIGVGCPGVIHSGIIEVATNLNFKNVNLKEILETYCQKDVSILNDANAAAYGEFIKGAGEGHHSLLMLTIGTGIGGGIILNDEIYSGFNGAGAEMGHIVINADGQMCRCGKRGCFELYCSARALVNSTKKAMNEDKDSLMWKLCEGNINKADGHTAFDAAKRKDKSAMKVVDTFMRYLSIGVSNLISIFQPEVLCIGGGISAEGDAITVPLTNYVTAQSYISDEKRRTKILTAKLANDAGLIGAAMFAKEEQGRVRDYFNTDDFFAQYK